MRYPGHSGEQEVSNMSDTTSESTGDSRLTRRKLIAVGGASALGLYLGGVAPGSAATRKAITELLPVGVAPAGDRFWVIGVDSTGATYKALDFYETVYSAAPLGDNFSIPLVRMNKNFVTVPGAATGWRQTSPLTWEFDLHPGIMWSDGNELTAADYVETMRYSADPKHAWDFSWYWSGVIKNFTEAVAGKVPTSAIGVAQGKDKYTIVFTTETPIAYMPAALLYSNPLSAAALSKYGSGSYNLNPGTVVTSGPYTLHSFDPTDHVVLERNPKYNGPFAAKMDALIAKLYAGGDMLPRFETGEIDVLQVSAVDLKIAKGNSKLKTLHLYTNPQNFQNLYVFFRTKTPPFNNVKVRQAFAHSVDRTPLIKATMGPLAIPSYGYLMPGYPFAITDPLIPHTNYDPALAQKLLAEAGYPKGKGFPKITFNWWPYANANAESVVQILAEHWNKILFNGANKIQLQELDASTFYGNMNAKPTKIQMGFVSYGMDYFDASNMLGVYKSGGRHDWDNAQYDHLLTLGAAESNLKKRQAIYTKAQILYTKEAPGVNIFHLLFGYYTWPYAEGSALAKNKLGYDGLEFPILNYGLSMRTSELGNFYIGDNVGQYPRQSESSLL
jgi:ABC-type transport system substrate-binding protein